MGGAGEHVANGYRAGGQEPVYLMASNADEILASVNAVMAFTDAKYRVHLDKKAPGWRDNPAWREFYNRKATNEAAAAIRAIMAGRGTPMDGGTQ